MPHITQDRIERTLAIIIKAALANERCPNNVYGTGIESAALTRLAKTGVIRVEYSSVNYRCVHILKGEHKGRHTAPDPAGNIVYATLDRDGHKRIPGAVNNSHRSPRARPSLPKYSFMDGADGS